MLHSAHLHVRQQHCQLQRSFGYADNPAAVQLVVQVQAAVGTKIKNTTTVSSAEILKESWRFSSPLQRRWLQNSSGRGPASMWMPALLYQGTTLVEP